jgi:hypothetical protein
MIEYFWRKHWNMWTYWPIYFDYEWMIDEEIFAMGSSFLLMGSLFGFFGLCTYWTVFSWPSLKKVTFYMPWSQPAMGEYFQTMYFWETHLIWAKITSYLEEAYYRKFIYKWLKGTYLSRMAISVGLSGSPFMLFWMICSNKTWPIIIGTFMCIANYFLCILYNKKGFLETLMFKQG